METQYTLIIGIISSIIILQSATTVITKIEETKDIKTYFQEIEKLENNIIFLESLTEQNFITQNISIPKNCKLQITQKKIIAKCKEHIFEQFQETCTQKNLTEGKYRILITFTKNMELGKEPKILLRDETCK